MFLPNRHFRIIILFLILFFSFYATRHLLISSTSRKCFSDSFVKGLSNYSLLNCKINDQVLVNLGRSNETYSQISCLQNKDNEYYVPFSFLKNTFEIRGEKINSESLSLSTSFSKVFPELKTIKYETNGTFLQFGNYDVESRPRVLCVSASENVPLSTQWNKKGYYYSTQISQYALSHYSKLFKESLSQSKTVYENGYETKRVHWIGNTSRDLSLKCLYFESPIFLELNNSNQYVLTLSLLNSNNSSFKLSLKDGNHIFHIYYVPTNVNVHRHGNTVTFGYGLLSNSSMMSFTRDLLNDFNKGFQRKRSSPKTLIILSIHFDGIGCLSTLALGDQEHLRMFYHGADWLVRHQNTTSGGWPVSVIFNEGHLKYPSAQEISSGWHSGMAQGHAISVLSRAFYHSGDFKYLKTALHAFQIYGIPSSQGGVLTYFLDEMLWFEEYPTNPPTFVLNGFMYALLGLYDLKQSLLQYKNSSKEQEIMNGQVNDFFTKGCMSLYRMIPFYDTGSGSFYDLRHFTMGVAPKIARWDYHSTHINLLYAFSTLDIPHRISKFFVTTGDRWSDYMLGHKTSHN